MTGMREDLDRKLHHQQPRTRHVNATRPDTQPCPNPACVGGRIDTTPPTASHPAAQTDTTCPICDGTGEADTR